MNREVFTPHFPICIYNYRYESIAKNVSEAMLSSTDAGGLQYFPLRASPHPSPPPRRGNMRLDSSLCNPRPLWEREQLCLSCAKTTNAGEGMNPLEKKHIYIHPHQGSAQLVLPDKGRNVCLDKFAEERPDLSLCRK